MLGPLPGPPEAAEGQTNGCVTDQARREAMGATDLGGQCEGPPAGGRAQCPWTLRQQRLQGLAGPSLEDGRRGVRARREGLQHGETALVAGMNDVAHGLIGPAEAASNHGRRLALGTGQKPLAAADGDRRPVSSVARSSAVSGRTNQGVCISKSLPHVKKPLLEVH
jgi:hypothetical protein